MSAPLKRKDQQGVTYQRPAEIEVWISKLETVDAGERLSQFALPKKSLSYVPSEVLVYFLRRAWGAADHEVFEKTFRLLLARVDRSLRSRLWDSDIGNASDICDEIISRFVLLITNDCNSDKGLLDFYEIRFDRAICTIRASVLRKFYTEVGDVILVPFDHQDIDGAPLSAEVEATLDNYLSDESSKIDDPAFRIALFSAIDQLPHDQRQVIGLRLKGIPVQSNDPSVMTIARMLQCDDRTVRNRSARALKSLKAALEEEVGK
ncbi:sigma-70 family RNA polymerase sigma factor [Pseudomonas sp. WS 5079]|uniref:RNA polymerase sigma factor n=1 Tax=Pseudomonas sp. WS 5079 TaxID=2717492 RepID=UPI001556C96E|nr:sigma-70 family RNA polymerase sigma factor [Pseudomonas sp. WS 5079]NMX60331.1 sigma-70 family RNA polymerase sigma factor [Pseudomonas sp. WS 5079]